MSDGPRYEGDFYVWTQDQPMVLRSIAVADNRFDREHVAEEIEDLGNSERDAMRSSVCRIIGHRLKLAYSPAEGPRCDWIETLLEARQTLPDKISPTLRRDAGQMLEKLCAEARKRAAASLGRFGEPAAAEALPPSCPYSLDDVGREDWYPDRPGALP